MKKFSRKKKLHIKASFITTFVFALFILIMLVFVSSIGNQNTDRQEETLANALERDIMHCYALEGYYPPSLKYIEEHYGLVYDKEKYIVDYRPVANNIYPNIAIIKKGNSDKKEKPSDLLKSGGGK